MAKKIITMNIDGEEKHLKVGINALTDLEQLMERPLASIGDEISIADLRAMFYVSLKWEDKKMTLEQAGDLMDSVVEEKGFQFLAESLSELISSSMGGAQLPS
ncbi:hypothetical protein MXL49_16725 [Enterococcus casseliflavus]|uniref:hypothetical protein n=1 Tax=Enterococcus casseliflavus TaxID=37734 RepID=UPI002DBD09A7|nr:hypothetical protein [Enterococcus casseliflavus]MEB6213527.1 hypothetical protein [Enterococcus casseliflavus]